MPYITDAEKSRISQKLTPFGMPVLALYPKYIEHIGQLTWMIYKICMIYLENSTNRFADFCHIIGALDCAKEEFRRQELIPYEDAKKIENGDA